MIITVDANILFSALITPQGQLAKIISYPLLPAQLVSGYFLVEELTKYQEKIVRFAKRPESEVLDLQHAYLKNIVLYDETLIQSDHWLKAEELTDGVDHFDISYVALTLETGGVLWTGDKKLTNHLRKMKFDQVVNTVELAALLKLS